MKKHKYFLRLSQSMAKKLLIPNGDRTSTTANSQFFAALQLHRCDLSDLINGSAMRDYNVSILTSEGGPKSLINKGFTPHVKGQPLLP